MKIKNWRDYMHLAGLHCASARRWSVTMQSAGRLTIHSACGDFLFMISHSTESHISYHEWLLPSTDTEFPADGLVTVWIPS